MCTCTWRGCPSSGRARTAPPSPTTTWNASWRLGSGWPRGCDGSCSRIPGNISRPVWVDDDRFDLDFHLRRASVPSPGGRFELERAVGRVLSRPLDRTKPLWELYVFEDLADGRTAVLLKLHHAMADGIGGMMIASALFDLTPDAPLGSPDEVWSPEPLPPLEELIRDAVEEVILHPIQSFTHAVRQPWILAQSATATADALRTVAGMGTPPRGPFDGRVGPNRRFATAERPFEVFRKIKDSLGGTVNDVVLTAVAGGVHTLLAHRGEPTKGRTLRAMVPVSVRSPGDERRHRESRRPRLRGRSGGEDGVADAPPARPRRHRPDQGLRYGRGRRHDHRARRVRAAGAPRDGGAPDRAGALVQPRRLEHPGARRCRSTWRVRLSRRATPR